MQAPAHEPPARRPASGGERVSERRCAEFRHPTQTSLTRLCLFEEQDGVLVTEERIGSTTVVSTLGWFRSREEASVFADARAEELLAQRWRQVAGTAD